MATPKGTHIKIIKNDFPKIVTDIDNKARDIVRETTLFIEGAAKSAAPIGETGNLASGIQGGGDVEKTAEGYEGAVYDPIEYAAYVNYGTGSRGQTSDVPGRTSEITYTGSWLGMPANPFMSQAAEDGRARFNNAFQKLIK